MLFHFINQNHLWHEKRGGEIYKMKTYKVYKMMVYIARSIAHINQNDGLSKTFLFNTGYKSEDNKILMAAEVNL